MREKWVREWRGWDAARSELLGAQDVEDRCRVVEDRTVKFMLFLKGALVFEAKTDDERAEEMARSGRR
eukprot:3863302-Pyramimonas_sp.AAC.1